MKSIANRIQRLHGRDEIGRNKTRSLMDQLIESMLPVRPWLAPNNRPRRVAHTIAITKIFLRILIKPLPSNVFSVALHVALLEVGGETVQVLIVWKERVRFSAEEVVVPYAEHSQQHRDLKYRMIINGAKRLTLSLNGASQKWRSMK